MSVPLQSIVHLRPDTIGDLVIYSAALQALMEATPQARHTLVVRRGYEALTPLFPPDLRWVVADLNPFQETPAKAADRLEKLVGELEAVAPDALLASTLNRTWLEVALAARFPSARRIAFGGTEVDPLFATALRLDLGVTDTSAVFDAVVPAETEERDWAGNHRFMERVAGRSLPRTTPQLRVPSTAETEAHSWLAEQGLRPNHWLAIGAAGLANVPIKAWPPEKFGAVLQQLQVAHPDLPLVLIGHEQERDVLEATAQAIVSAGGRAPQLWLGREGELPLLAALLATSRAYLGHDTGAMHMAAATGRPTLGIFGGGHWPRFRPVGHQVMAVVHPLPCFGCNWDCYFGNAPCVKLIEPADVLAAAEQLLAAGDAPLDAVYETRHLTDTALALIAGATPRYRTLQRDRLDRQHKIEELKAESNDKDREIDELKQAAEERKTEMEAIKTELEAECASKDQEISELKQESDTKDVEITQLKRESDGKDVEITQLKRESDGKDTEIAQLKQEADNKDAEIAAIKQTANEREQLIITLDGHVKNFQAIVADRETHIGNLDRDRNAARAELAQAQAELAELRPKFATSEARRQEVETILGRLPPDAATWSQAIHDKDVHIANLETMLRQLREQVRELEDSLGNYAARRDSLESAKYYGRLLAQKEAVIQSLDRACQERERLIQSLALDSAGLGGRVRKLGLALGGFWRLKISTPFNSWLFRKVVEEYWMQIGILQHYQPRPLVWDERMLKRPTVPVERCPKIAIVTPSYGQATFIESTMLSVLNQKYPKLLYVVQDGGSKDATPEIVARYGDQLFHWESVRDRGQADAVDKGFKHVEGDLGPDDLMAWLNSDDLFAPRTFATVADFFARNPDVDVVYGHRIIIDPSDREVGRWVMPPHEPESLAWIDYVPQETMFWRKRAWDRAGGIDPSFQFALDWDLLARFTQAGCKIVRLPYFLGCFRVHPTQKTSAVIHTTGAEEMARIRRRFHGEQQDDPISINRWARRIRWRGAVTARLHELGLRW